MGWHKCVPVEQAPYPPGVPVGRFGYPRPAITQWLDFKLKHAGTGGSHTKIKGQPALRLNTCHGPVVDRITESLSRTSPEAMTRIRTSIDAAVDNSFSEQLDLEMEHQSVLIPQNMTEGAKAFMEKREPHFKGR